MAKGLLRQFARRKPWWTRCAPNTIVSDSDATFNDLPSGTGVEITVA
jgi:hypothetical protein